LDILEKREKSLAPSGIQTPDSAAHSLVTVPKRYYGLLVVMKTENGGKDWTEPLKTVLE
jgi:hypothetical protein